MNFLQALLGALMPHILEVAGVVVAILLAGLTRTLKDRWGIEIEARHREALHSALMSGIRAALGRGLAGQAAIDAAVSYARQSVPDALSRLDPDAGVLADLASSKLRQVLEGAPFFGIDLGKADDSVVVPPGLTVNLPDGGA